MTGRARPLLLVVGATAVGASATVALLALGPLIAEDEQRGADLVHTLNAYLQRNGATSATAKLLHLQLATERGHVRSDRMGAEGGLPQPAST